MCKKCFTVADWESNHGKIVRYPPGFSEDDLRMSYADLSDMQRKNILKMAGQKKATSHIANSMALPEYLVRSVIAAGKSAISQAHWSK